jgi:hypothetical protein
MNQFFKECCFCVLLRSLIIQNGNYRILAGPAVSDTDASSLRSDIMSVNPAAPYIGLQLEARQVEQRTKVQSAPADLRYAVERDKRELANSQF